MNSTRDADALFAQVIPELDDRERAAMRVEPGLTTPEVLDRALRAALAHLRVEVTQETLAYLTHRTVAARAAAVATRALSQAARQARVDARADRRPVGRDAVPAAVRTFTGAGSLVWAVYELAAAPFPWARGDRCLVFMSESAVRRVWHYPADWRALPDDALEALSWAT
jgi:hypothetical protein